MTEVRDKELVQILQALNTKEQIKQKPKSRVSKREPYVSKHKKHDDRFPSWFKLSTFGQQIADELEGYIAQSDPLLLIGGTGMGKTVILEMIALKLGRSSVGFNCYTGMDIAQLIGTWHPVADGTITWQDGILTQGIKIGAIIRIEEYTRANPELKSRLFGILDSRNRSWNVFESGNSAIEVPEETVIVASANPTGNGYIGTMREDKASMSRFAGVLTINEPLADEKYALMDTLEDNETVDKIMDFATACRKDPNTYLSTRDLHFFAKALKRGLDAKRVCESVLLPKYEGNESTILTHCRAYFETFDGESIKETVESEIAR